MMNPIRGRGFDAQQRSQFPFSVQASHRQLYPNVLPEIPQASDFRTSLILKDLSKRFSLLRSPTGEPVSVRHLKYKFAEQRRRGAKNQITEEEETMLLETLGRMRSRAGVLTGKPQDTINEYPEQHSGHSTTTTTTTSATPASPPSSPSGKPTKRYSNNLFGSGRLRDYAYFRNAGSSPGRAASPRAPSMTPTETSITIQEVSSIPDSLHLLISDNSSVQSSTDNKFVVAAPAPNEQATEPPSTAQSLALKRASMALADAIKELEETEDEVVMPRLRLSPDLSSRPLEGIAELARSSQSSLQLPTVVEAGTAISSDNHVITPFSDHRASPVHSRILPGYVPGMPRPMTPRDLESDERSHSTTPRAMSPLLAITADTTSPGVPQPLSSAAPRPGSISPVLSQSPRPPSPSAAAIRPSTPSRSTPLFLQRSPSGRRTPENGTSVVEPIEFDSPLNSSLMSKRRPSSPSTEPAYQPMAVSSHPSTPSNIIWNVGLAETNHKRISHERNGSWTSDASNNDVSSHDMYGSRFGHGLTPLPDSPLVDQVFGIDLGPNLSGSNRVARSPTPTHTAPRSPGISATVDTSPRNSSKRSSRQTASSPFLFGQYPPLVLLPVVNSSRSSLESIGSSYHTWDGDKDRCLSMFCDPDTQQPAWHDIHVERSSSVSSGESTEDWDPEEIIGRYAGLKKSDFKAMQEKLIALAAARDDARERVPSIRRRRPSTSQSNYSVNGRDRVASPPPASPTATNSEQNARATAVLSTIADAIQARQPEPIDTSVQRVPDTEPSPNTRRHRDLAQALFGDDIEREREQTPKPLPLQFSRDPDSECEEASKSVEISDPEMPMASGSSLGHTQSIPGSFQEVDLAREVQEKAEAATLALRRNPSNTERRLERSILGSISRRRINPNQISEPRLVSASTSVDTIPVRAPQSNNTGASKIGSKFRKLRGSLRAKNPPSVREEARIQSNAHSPPPSQIVVTDVSKATLPANGANAVGNGKLKDTSSSAPTSIAPGLRGFMARFRSKKGTDNGSADRRDAPHISPSVVSLAASQVDRPTLPQPTANNSVVPSSGSSLQHVSEQSYASQEAAAISDSNEVALRQLFNAASNLGLDQNALNALLARSSSLSRPPERQAARKGVSMPTELEQEAGKRDQPMSVPLPETESNPRAVPKQVYSDRGVIKSAEVPDPRAGEYRVSEDSMPETMANVAVRRIIIYPSDSQIPLDLPPLPKKGSHRRRASVVSASSRSIQDRAPTPPPPKSPTSKSFINGFSPPVPQIPHSLLANTESRTGPHATRHSFEKPNSAYDSLYEMYSEEVASSTGNEILPPMAKADTNANPEIPALELIELANGETIWSIVNGLRDDDNESSYAGRMSFASEFSARDPNPDGLQAFAKEHRKTGSKGSGSSFASRRRPLHGKSRPDTKVYYSSSAQIGRLIENLSQGVDSSSLKISPDPHRPGHSASSSLSLPPSNDAHWTVEERLEHLLESIANR